MWLGFGLRPWAQLGYTSDTNMEVDGMVPWKTTFFYEQGVLHFHVSESGCRSWDHISRQTGGTGAPSGSCSHSLRQSPKAKRRANRAPAMFATWMSGQPRGMVAKEAH